uniref:G_PROTEIN_RECEP_F2_4 domain-containing protein n=1 Tax=Caenorhabditis tropicalis TaxID=1561998 RepID=A0A1I7TTR6_9PELO
MKAIYVWLFLFQLPFLDSCLVVRTDQCRCPYRFLDHQAVIAFPMYTDLLANQIQNPLITGDNCSLTMYCEEGYELVFIDTNKLKEFGEYSGDALCDKRTQTWLINDDVWGLTPFKKLDAFCKEIPSDECRCPYRFLDHQAVIAVPQFSAVLPNEIKNPSISGDKFSFHFGEYSADAICDKSTKTWSVSDDGGFTPFNKLDAFCRVITDDCGPNDKTSLIIAYSNGLGLDSNFPAQWFEGMAYSTIGPRVTEFGSIRFDSPIEEDIQLHNSIPDIMNSIASNLKAPLSGTPQNDVRSAIEKILSTKKLQICGATVVIYVNYRVEIFNSEELIAQLRTRHISVYTWEPYFSVPSYLSWISTKTYGHSVVSSLTERAGNSEGNFFFVYAPLWKKTYDVTITYDFPDNDRQLISVRIGSISDQQLDAWAPYND